MVNSFLKFLSRDKQLIFNFVFILALFICLSFLRNLNKAEKRDISLLKEKKELISRIGEFEKRLSSLFLSGIISTEKGSAAVINNNILRAGDKIAVNTVVKIDKDSVILNDGSKDFELKLVE